MIKNGKYTLYVDIKWNGGLFDVDEDGVVTSVLRMFHTKKGKEVVEFERFQYSHYNFEENYRLATDEDLIKYGCFYYNDDGTRPYKTKSCETCPCKDDGTCFHNTPLYNKLGLKV